MFLEGAEIIIYFLFNPTLEGAWIDQKVQKLLGPSKKQFRSATVYFGSF